jgi:hypothetical protein
MIGRDILVMEQVTPPTFRPFRLIEVYMTCDGPRTRVCSGTWKTREEAETERDLKRANQVLPVKDPPEEDYDGRAK